MWGLFFVFLDWVNVPIHFVLLSCDCTLALDSLQFSRWGWGSLLGVLSLRCLAAADPLVSCVSAPSVVIGVSHVGGEWLALGIHLINETK